MRLGSIVQPGSLKQLVSSHCPALALPPAGWRRRSLSLATDAGSRHSASGQLHTRSPPLSLPPCRRSDPAAPPASTAGKRSDLPRAAAAHASLGRPRSATLAPNPLTRPWLMLRFPPVWESVTAPSNWVAAPGAKVGRCPSPSSFTHTERWGRPESPGAVSCVLLV